MRKKRNKKKNEETRRCAASFPYFCLTVARSERYGSFWAKVIQEALSATPNAFPLCYISGGISHYDLKERMATFDRAATALAKAGYKPVNPFNNGVPQSSHWREHMRRDIGLLLKCDYIYMLKGWELSKGAKLELDVASSCGIKVLFEH